MKTTSSTFFQAIKNTKKYVIGLSALVIFVGLIREMTNLNQSLRIGGHKSTHLHSTVGWVDKVELLPKNHQKVTYSYFVSNQSHKNSQIIDKHRDIREKDLVKINHCVKNPLDSCIAAQMPNDRLVFYWLFLFSLMLVFATVLSQMLIDIYEAFQF